MNDRSGTDLGSYRLIARLGEGGMGTVYRAIHTRMGRAVAIKILHPELCSDQGVIDRFFHEARAANIVRHPHVIEVFDFVDSGPDIYFVMELLHGADLHDAIYRLPEPMPLARATGILGQIAAALDAAHTHDIVHRDLKPENIFLGAHDYVKVFDFGIAKLRRLDGKATVQGTMLGTPEYMAPEQVRGEPVDARTDIYALGCIAYELFTRRQAFAGGSQAQVLVRQLSVMPASPRTFVPSLPTAVEELVMAALAKNPAARPASAREFARQLAAATGASPKAVPEVPPASLLSNLVTQRAGRWPLRTTVLTACAVMAIGFAVAMWRDRTDDPRGPDLRSTAAPASVLARSDPEQEGERADVGSRAPGLAVSIAVPSGGPSAANLTQQITFDGSAVEASIGRDRGRVKSAGRQKAGVPAATLTINPFEERSP